MQIEERPLDIDLSITSKENIEIYSKRAIWGFSIFFTPLVGGILLMQNLKDIDNRKAAYQVLAFSIIYTLGTIGLLNIIMANTSSLTTVFSIGGGYILSEVFFKKYFKSPERYQNKNVVKPLIICSVLLVGLLALMFYSAGLYN